MAGFSPPEVRTDSVTTDDGVDLAVVTAGSGPGLVLVHGFGAAKEDFTEHLGTLGRDHCAVAFDQRGHGASGKPPDRGAYSLRRLAADVVAIADALGLDRFSLLGHSAGGMVAQHVVLDHPDRVVGLVLMNTWPGAPPGFRREDGELAARIASTEGMAALLERMGEGGVLPTPAHERVLRERPGYREFNDRKFLAQSPEMYAALVTEILDRSDMSPRLRLVDCPTLVMVGEQDVTARPGCERLAAVIPGARFVTVPDAGHSPQFENPEAWAVALRAFLADLPR